jgi:hypothetical protein
MKRSEIIRITEKAIAKQQAFVAECLTCSQRNNPQVVAAMNHADGQADGLKSVLRALKGDLLDLKITAGEA